MIADPIAAAFAVSPTWLHRIRDFDALEIAACVLLGRDAEGQEILERLDDDHPSPFCWTVYGHLTSGGVEALEDFATEAEANAFATAMEGLFPHLA